jgi:hypothetical protein
MLLPDHLLNERLKRVVIEWSYPKTYDRMWRDDRIYDFGLYYITAHRVRCRVRMEESLYIGQTSISFESRFIEHDENWFHEIRGQKYIRLGKITYPTRSTRGMTKTVIHDVERALIYDMGTVLRQNIMGINSYSPNHLYTIANNGFRGGLQKVISMRDHFTKKTAPH